MTPQEFAALLNGRQHREEMTKDEEKQAKENGLVVVFGASDDLMEFRGAIYDEIGAWQGTTEYLTETGIFDENGCEDDNCEYKRTEREKCKTIKAKWDDNGYCWTYETEIPHTIFDIIEDENQKYCRGIVFHISSLK